MLGPSRVVEKSTIYACTQHGSENVVKVQVVIRVYAPGS